MNDKAERSNRPEATVGEATGLAPAAEVARLVAALAAAEEDGHVKAGLLADLADALFGDPERAERHGYDGLVERAAALVLDLGRARNEVVKALADTGAAEKRRMEAERAAVEAKGDALRLRLVVEAKDRGLAAAGATLGKIQHKVRLAFAARKGEARMPESLTLALDPAQPGGDQTMWCVLYGVNLQEGIAGFGPTPDEAVVAFAEAVRASQGKAGEEAALAAVYDLAVPSLDPETFDALTRALGTLAHNRHVAWMPEGRAEAPGAVVVSAASVVVDGRTYTVPGDALATAESVAAALRAQGLDAFVNADGALSWRVPEGVPSRVEVARPADYRAPVHFVEQDEGPCRCVLVEEGGRRVVRAVLDAHTAAVCRAADGVEVDAGGTL